MAVLALGTIVTAGVCVIVQAAMDLNDNVIDGDDDKFCERLTQIPFPHIEALEPSSDSRMWSWQKKWRVLQKTQAGCIRSHQSGKGT